MGKKSRSIFPSSGWPPIFSMRALGSPNDFPSVREFIPAHGESMHPVVYETIVNAARYTAVDAFHARYRLEELRRASEAQWSRMDVLFLPTTGTTYTHKAVTDDPIGTNTNLGYYTNFVNLLDLAAVAVPAGFRANGLPFGASLIGPAFSDEALLILADRFHRSQVILPGPVLNLGTTPPGCIAVAVVGTHLSNQPLHGEIIESRLGLFRVRSHCAELSPLCTGLRQSAHSRPGEGRELLRTRH